MEYANENHREAAGSLPDQGYFAEHEPADLTLEQLHHVLQTGDGVNIARPRAGCAVIVAESCRLPRGPSCSSRNSSCGPDTRASATPQESRRARSACRRK